MNELFLETDCVSPELLCVITLYTHSDHHVNQAKYEEIWNYDVFVQMAGLVKSLSFSYLHPLWP